jgi:PKD repeat protein
VHIYTVPGTYTVSLTVGDGTGLTDTKTEWFYIVVTSVPTADFTANVTLGRAPLAVQFTSITTGATAWQWSFGDGGSSAEQHPVHVYSMPGVYDVILTASHPTYGTVVVTKYAYIRVTDPPVVDFTMNVSSGPVPLTVGFTDITTGNPFFWWWDFGDGTNSFSQHPVHTFAQAGSRTVTLTAFSINGSGTATHIVVAEPIDTPTATPTSEPTTTPTATPEPTSTGSPEPTATATTTPTPIHTPFVNMTLPGRVQAENYDLGGEGVAYHDTTPGNTGGVYRQDDVDIERIDGGDDTPNVGWIRIGEFMTYTVDIPQSATYVMTSRVSSNRTNRYFEVYLDDGSIPLTRVAVPKTVITYPANVSVPYTVEWEYFTDVETLIDLPGGVHTLRFSFPIDYLNLNWMDFSFLD